MVEQKWCLILGASSGMGKASARALAADGWNVIGVHLDMAEQLDEVAKFVSELESCGVQTRFFNVNADSQKVRRALLDDIPGIIGPASIGLILHSLAFGTLLPFIRDPEDQDVIQKNQMDMTMSVMAHSLVYWVQDSWTRGLLRNGSKIFAMTSSGSVMYSRNYGAVSAAKCALESHVRQLALELAPHGIAVNCLRAGITDTPALRKIPESDALLRRAAENNPHGRLSTTDDVGNALRHLTEVSGSWITGNVINVDGGEILTI